MTAAGVFQTTAGSNLILNAPGSNRLNGKQFRVKASGWVTTASGTYTATIQPVLYGDAVLSTVTTKPLFSATAGTIAFTGTVAGAVPWALTAWMEGDTLSGTVSGAAQSVAGVTYKIATQLVPPVTTTINFATEPPIKFAVGIATAGTLGATPKFVINEFTLDED